MHCGEAQGDTMELALQLYNLVWTSFFLSGLWPKAELGSTHGIGLGVFYSVSEWNADKTRVDKVRYWTAVTCSCRIICAGQEPMEAGSMERLDLVIDSSYNILTLDACRFCLGPRPTWSCHVHADTAGM
jgi:hypothetical protein